MNHEDELYEDEEATTSCIFGMCDGSGEIPEMEPVYPGEPHMAPIGSRKCQCKMVDDFVDQEEYDYAGSN